LKGWKASAAGNGVKHSTHQQALPYIKPAETKEAVL